MPNLTPPPRPTPARRSVVLFVWGATEADVAAVERWAAETTWGRTWRIARTVRAVGAPERGADRRNLRPRDLLLRQADYGRVLELYSPPPVNGVAR